MSHSRIQRMPDAAHHQKDPMCRGRVLGTVLVTSVGVDAFFFFKLPLVQCASSVTKALIGSTNGSVVTRTDEMYPL